MKIDDAWLHWLAGFIDGEGCFTIRYHKAQKSFYCRLHVMLRRDDLPILLEIQEKLGMGSIYLPKLITKGRPGANPSAMWQVSRIGDLMRIVEIFDTHPLRAKKAIHFQIWRKAVTEIAGGMSKGRQPATYNKSRLNYLTKKLHLIKTYEAPICDEYDPGSDQLELPFDEDLEVLKEE